MVQRSQFGVGACVCVHECVNAWMHGCVSMCCAGPGICAAVGRHDAAVLGQKSTPIPWLFEALIESTNAVGAPCVASYTGAGVFGCTHVAIVRLRTLVTHTSTLPPLSVYPRDHVVSGGGVGGVVSGRDPCGCNQRITCDHWHSLSGGGW